MTDQELALTIYNNQVEIQKIDQALAQQLAIRKQLNDQIQEAKNKIKEIMPEGKISKQIGDNELTITTWSTTSVTEDDVSKIAPEYLTEKEIYNVIERDGHYYQKSGNTTLIKNMVKAGLPCPDGFKLKQGHSISIKFNGEAI